MTRRRLGAAAVPALCAVLQAGSAAAQGGPGAAPFQPSALSLFRVGGSTLQYQTPVTGTLATVAGSAIATLSSANGPVLPGDRVLANAKVSPETVVVWVSGASVVLSRAAAGSGSSTTQFGIQRQSVTSTSLGTTIGATNLYAGGAAAGRSTWLNQLASATDFPSAAPLFALAPAGGVGSASWLASRSSDSSQAPLPMNNEIMWTDYVPPGLQVPWSTWARYTESDLTSWFQANLTTTAGSKVASVPIGAQPRVGMPIADNPNLADGTTIAVVNGLNVTLSTPAQRDGTALSTFGSLGYHIGEENSVYSLWKYTFTDPYLFNPVGGTRNLRLDCGKGATFERFGPPQNCSAALEIVDNDAIYGKGIVFGLNALDTTEHGLGQAVVMAPFQALVWYYANNTPGWSIYQDAMSTAGGAQFQLHLSNGFADFGNAEVHANGSLISTGFGSSPNSLVMSGGATGNLAGIGTVNGPLAIAATGPNTTYLGSPTSATQVQGALGVGGSASVGADLAVTGHIYGASAPPTVSGGTLSAGANDTHGTITFAAAGTAVLKFIKGHNLKPDCVVWSADGPQPNGGTTAGPAGTAGLTIAAPSAEMVTYICMGG